MRRFSRFILLLSTAFFLAAAFAMESSAQSEKAKNVIIFIGDGMGFNSDLAGTFYRYGAPDKQSYHTFPVHLACTTFCSTGKLLPTFPVQGYDPAVFWTSLNAGNQGTQWTRTTDSAAAATALFSGMKTLSGSIGMDSFAQPVELISEVAAKLGKKVGAVTTVAASHATPGGFAAHVKSRGQMDEIFRQMTAENSPLTVVMGAGNPMFDDGKPIKVKEDESEKDKTRRFLSVGGEETWKKLETGEYNGFTVLQTRKQFEELAAGKTVPEKVIGLPYCNGSIPPVDGTLDEVPETKQSLEKSYKNRAWKEIPSLATMTLGALNVLSNDNDEGFLLMVEGGAIDSAGHGQNLERNSFEHVGFTKAIDATLAWIEKNSSWDETLVIVTADHETGQLFGPGTYSDDNDNGVFDEGDVFNGFTLPENQGRGRHPKAQYGSKSHTNALVPLWAKGPGATLFLDRMKGIDEKAAAFWPSFGKHGSGKYVDNTDVFQVIRAAMSQP